MNSGKANPFMFSSQALSSALRGMNDNRPELDRNKYIAIPGSNIGVRKDLLLNRAAGQQEGSSNGRAVKHNRYNPMMMNMRTGNGITQQSLEKAQITMVEIDENQYLYQKNEQVNNTLCRISEKNKRIFLEPVFVGGDDNGFVDKMVAKVREIGAQAKANKEKAEKMCDKAIKTQKSADMYTSANEMLDKANAEISIAEKMNDCYQNKDWGKLRESKNECLKKIQEFDDLSRHVSIKQSDQKVTINIVYFNKLLTTTQAIDNHLEDKPVKDFITVLRDRVECKVISPGFELVSGCKMNLRLYPTGTGALKGKCLSVFFDQAGKAGKLPKPTNAMKMTLLNHADEEKSVTINMASGKDQYLRKVDMLDLELLKDSEQSKSDFLKDGTLVMQCQFLDSISPTVVPVSS